LNNNNLYKAQAIETPRLAHLFETPAGHGTAFFIATPRANARPAVLSPTLPGTQSHAATPRHNVAPHDVHTITPHCSNTPPPHRTDNRHPTRAAASPVRLTSRDTHFNLSPTS